MRERKQAVPNLPVAPNHLNRNFQAAQPDMVYVGDITHIPTTEGGLYLAIWMDLYSRTVVGWSMADHMRASRVCDALQMAYFRCRPARDLLVHSDRGSQ